MDQDEAPAGFFSTDHPFGEDTGRPAIAEAPSPFVTSFASTREAQRQATWWTCA